MKIVLYQCDWCGVREPPDDRDDAWPKGWSNLDEHGNDDLLCVECMYAAKLLIARAIETAKSDRKLVAVPPRSTGEG